MAWIAPPPPAPTTPPAEAAPQGAAATDGPAENPSVARGTGSPADKKLVEGDAAYARGDYQAAEKAYRTAADLDRKDPAPIVGAVRARLAKDDVPSDFGGAPTSPAL
ncbi:MAG TPA: hypothetical protein VK459_15360, partial [Polyangiaceae bacterium]|nr:hypothetical protein [Polyangiaceae bacterium]